MTDYTTQDYWDTVKSIAQEAFSECEDDDNRQQFITESVDGNAYVIYYAAHEVALQATDNEPDGDEVKAMSNPDADWRDQRMLAVYLAMEADCAQELYRIIEEADEEAA